MMELKDKTVLILGLGETGLSLARWLNAQGARLRAADTRAEPPGLAELKRLAPDVEVQCGPFKDSLLRNVDVIALSPGVPAAEPLVQHALNKHIPVVGDIELFAQALPEANRPKIIAITGSNGKTTVTSMVGTMCRAAGLDVEVAGNISPAVLDALMQRGERQPQVWVLELSSFQLETTHSLRADAATVLNISVDHMDRYPDMEAYAEAKARILIGCGVRVLNRDDARSNVMVHPGDTCIKFGVGAPQRCDDWGIAELDGSNWLVLGKTRVLDVKELRVAGMHNAINALAALALCHAIELPLEPLCEGLRAFTGLPHRMEKIADIGGVEYYDDSKGTNVGATEAALKGLGKPAVVILGGDGKGQDFSPLNAAVARHARAAVLIGRDAGQIEAALAGCGKEVTRARDLEDAVHVAATLVQPGDAVLLSPACASFDMFRNYVHRAEIFATAVNGLRKEAA